MIGRFSTAWNFLTALPFPFTGEKPVTGESLGKSLAAFPWVGLVLGGAAGGCYLGLARLFPPLLTALGTIFFLVLATRGFHLDGLADTVDGLQGKTREASLRIMKESTIGAFGAVGLIFLIAFKVSALSLLSPSEALPALLIMPILGRTVFVALLVFFPAARPKEGLGEGFISKAGKIDWVFALSFALLTVWAIGRFRGIAVMVPVIGFAFLAGAYFRRRLGGVTGDTVGGTGEMAEALLLILWNIKWPPPG